MKTIEIFFQDDSKLSEFEAKNKGYRTDVYVKIENAFYNVRVYDIFTLQQDFEREQNSFGYYSIEPNLVLVKDANKTEIIETIKKLYEQKYFEYIKPVEHIEISKLVRVE
jgi:hypothetical protein